MKQVLITTSWDDGHKLDMRLAALLRKYNIKGTFYISPRDREFAAHDRLQDEDIRAISKDFEIGAHTMTHPRLPQLSDSQAKREIVESKKYLEHLTKSKLTSFCYPGGNYEARHVAMVGAAGFTYARSIRRHSFNLKGSLLEADTTVNTYNHFQDLWKIARFAGFSPVKTIRYFQWDNLAKAMFDRVIKEGGIFHLWGHSWEIDKHKDWEKLENVLRYIGGRKRALYATNGELPNYRPKRLLIAAPYFPPHAGGQEYYAYNIAKQLKSKYGWSVCVATSGRRGLRPAKTAYAGLTVYRLPYWIKISNTPFSPLWPLQLRRIIKHENVTIINAHAPVPLFADVAIRIARRTPVVITYHMLSMKKHKLKTDWLIGLYEHHVLPMTLRSAVRIICPSDIVRESLKAFKDKSRTISPGVDIDQFSPAKDLPQYTVLYVGSLRRSDNHKGVSYLLRAMAEIIKTHPKTKLHLVGADDGQAYFKNLANRIGLSGHVHFHGVKHGNGLAAVYRQASVFVLPSLNESFGMVVLEAMASGLPVIGTKVGGLPNVIDEGRTGYLIAPAESRVLTEKIIYLLDHPKKARQLGRAGRNKAERHLSWHLQADKTDRLLQEALETTGGRS
ncbi:MAG TPA: glycosyltransferase [Candidatus Saccharimonadales bacterium]|nr:glycosyltransferase [Candidatus Saccharimonadales bacterium]